MNSPVKHFRLAGEDFVSEPYHYRACGLENVYLLNGFTIEETGYGRGVSIHNVDDLHRAIALQLIMDSKPLSPREFRFLRKEMDQTQEELAKRLKLDAQTIARYEKEQSSIPRTVDLTLRVLYVVGLLPPDKKLEVLEDVVDDLDDDESSSRRALYFSQTDDHWNVGCH